MVLLVALFSIDPLNLRKGEGRLVEARITRLTSHGNRHQGRWPGLRVYAATADGARGVTTVLPGDLEGCDIGDVIEARQDGLKLYLSARPCK